VKIGKGCLTEQVVAELDRLSMKEPRRNTASKQMEQQAETHVGYDRKLKVHKHCCIATRAYLQENR
jgi:hypothetical protein